MEKLSVPHPKTWDSSSATAIFDGNINLNISKLKQMRLERTEYSSDCYFSL